MCGLFDQRKDHSWEYLNYSFSEKNVLNLSTPKGVVLGKGAVGKENSYRIITDHVSIPFKPVVPPD